MDSSVHQAANRAILKQIVALIGEKSDQCVSSVGVKVSPSCLDLAQLLLQPSHYTQVITERALSYGWCGNPICPNTISENKRKDLQKYSKKETQWNRNRAHRQMVTHHDNTNMYKPTSKTYSK